VLHPLSPFGQDLELMPVGLHHGDSALDDVVVRNVFVEQIGHAVYEDPHGGFPGQWFIYFLGDQPEVKALFKRMPWDATEPFGESLGVAVLTAWADLRASTDRVPGAVRPLYGGFLTHLGFRSWQWLLPTDVGDRDWPLVRPVGRFWREG